MFPESFAIVTPLHIVEATSVAAVVARIDAAFIINLTAEGVATAFSKDLIDLFFRMVSPDQLTQ